LNNAIHLQDICGAFLYMKEKIVLESSWITPETPKTAVVVMKLPDILLGRGHTLWMVNFYNSPELARQLNFEHSTVSVGTLKLTRKNAPKEVNDKKLKKGKTIVRHSSSVTVLKWCDERSVTMVSIYHRADTQRVSKQGKEKQKPLCD